MKQQEIKDLGKLEKSVNEICQRFHLKFIGSGISRFVFKEKYSRTVLKVSTQTRHNFSEYCFYQALEGTNFQKLFAASTEISKDGTVLEQEYVPKNLPSRCEAISFKGGNNWIDFLAEIESTLNFIKLFTKEPCITFDLHTDNIRLDSKYNAKIIDYAPILSPFIEAKKPKIQACISGLRKYTQRHDQRVEFFLDQQKSLVFKTQFDTNKLTLA